MSSKYALCQDCLRISDGASLVDDGVEGCKCGGDICNCSDCSECAEKLLNGERLGSKLGLKEGAKIIWNKDTGHGGLVS